MCMYCYLVCNYNKCSYLRIFVNTKEILDKLIKKSLNDEATNLHSTFEIGSNSDLLLENLVTNNLKQNIEYFLQNTKYSKITFPTKFKYIEPLLNIKHDNRVLIRMSLNPEKIIKNVEFKTSSLDERIDALNILAKYNYPIHILIAPVIILDDFFECYKEFIEYLAKKLSLLAKTNITFEIIFMTYSFVHDKINTEAFKNSIKIFDKCKMKSTGIGKYRYKDDIKNTASDFLIKLLNKNFINIKIAYIV